MSEEIVIDIGSQAVMTVLYIAGPMLAAAMIIGIIVSIIQTITQVNEATLTFIPKMFAVVGTLVILAPWMLKIMMKYTASVLTDVSMWIR